MKIQKALVFVGVSIISPFGKTIPEEALDAHANYVMRIKDVERTDRSKTRENIKKATTYCPNCPDQTQLCIEASKFYILNNFLNKSSSHYFYNNSIILLLPVENTFQILSLVVKYVPPVTWPDQKFCCHPNMGDAGRPEIFLSPEHDDMARPGTLTMSPKYGRRTPVGSSAAIECEWGDPAKHFAITRIWVTGPVRSLAVIEYK